MLLIYTLNAEMHQAMKAAVSLQLEYPRRGLVCTVDQQGIPTCRCTSVPCMFRAETPHVVGDMSIMPCTIEEALTHPDHAKWREALEVSATHSMKVWQVALSREGAFAVGCKMLFGIKQPSGRCKCRLIEHGCSQEHGEDYG